MIVIKILLILSDRQGYGKVILNLKIPGNQNFKPCPDEYRDLNFKP